MGFAMSWLAVSGAPPAQVLEALGLVRTGVMEEFPESPLAWAALPNGWAVFVAQQTGAPLIARETAARLSQGGVVVAGMVEEHVMCSEAVGYTGGRMQWRVSHDAQRDWQHLDTEGTLPAEFDAIQAQCRASQAAEGGEDSEVDYIFEIPVLLAQQLTSFRYDAVAPVSFEVLEDPVAPKGKPWWRLW